MSDLEDQFLGQAITLGLPEPFREYKFAQALLGRDWRADFAWLGVWPPLLVEIEGGTRARGRHNRADGFQADTEKYNAAVLLGFRLLRFTSEDVTSGRAVTLVESALGGDFPWPPRQPYQEESIVCPYKSTTPQTSATLFRKPPTTRRPAATRGAVTPGSGAGPSPPEEPTTRPGSTRSRRSSTTSSVSGTSSRTSSGTRTGPSSTP